MKSLLLKNKNHILILKIVLIVFSILPIIGDLIGLSETIKVTGDEFKSIQLLNYLIRFYLIPIALFICTVLIEKKFLFILTLLTLNIVAFLDYFGFYSLYRFYNFIVLAVQREDFFYMFVRELNPFTYGVFDGYALIKLVDLIMIFVTLTMSVIILVKFSKGNYNIPLKSLIPFITLFLLYYIFLIIVPSYYVLLPANPILQLIIVIYLAFYPKKFKEHYHSKLPRDISLTELNDLYIIGNISEEEYYLERQKIIDNI